MHKCGVGVGGDSVVCYTFRQAKEEDSGGVQKRKKKVTVAMYI